MWPEIDRPTKNKRTKPGDYDVDLEKDLRYTMITNKAIVVPLWLFHSSPAKGRIWKDGFSVRHRVMTDRQTVAAWVENAT